MVKIQVPTGHGGTTVNTNNVWDRIVALESGVTVPTNNALSLKADKSVVDGLTTQLAESTTDLEQREINVKKWAKGDGVTDDTQSFIDAIAYAQSKNIFKLRVPDGTYIIDPVGTDSGDGGRIRIPSNFEIVFSPNAILKSKVVSSGYYAVLAVKNVSNVTIRGGTIIGDRSTTNKASGNNGFGIHIISSTNVKVYDTSVKDCWGDGIKIGTLGTDITPNQDIVVAYCTADNNRRNGIAVTCAKNVLIHRCISKNTNGTLPESGIDIEASASNQPVENVTVSNCTITDNNGFGIDVIDCDYTVVKHNYVKNNISGQLRTQYHAFDSTFIGNIFLSNNANPCLTLLASTHDLLISNNTIYAGTGNAIMFGTDCIAVKVSSNKIYGTGGNAPLINLSMPSGTWSSAMKNVVIENNHIEYSNGSGIEIFNTTNIKIKNNTITRCLKAIKISADVASQYAEVTISNNELDRIRQHGFDLNYVKNSLINSNVFFNIGTDATSTYIGINLYKHMGNLVKGNKIINSSLLNAISTTGPLNTTTSKTILLNNDVRGVATTPIVVDIGAQSDANYV
jgi:parallel beta-helix repeat protein